jgi:hypothetical protein
MIFFVSSKMLVPITAAHCKHLVAGYRSGAHCFNR